MQDCVSSVEKSPVEKSIESIDTQLENVAKHITNVLTFDPLKFQKDILAMEKLGCSKFDRVTLINLLLSNAVLAQDLRIVTYVALYRRNAFTHLHAQGLYASLFEMYKDDAYNAIVKMIKMRAGDSISKLDMYVAVIGNSSFGPTHTCLVHFGKLPDTFVGLILDIPYENFESRLKVDGLL